MLYMNRTEDKNYQPVIIRFANNYHAVPKK